MDITLQSNFNIHAIESSSNSNPKIIESMDTVSKQTPFSKLNPLVRLIQLFTIYRVLIIRLIAFWKK